ncbi:MAG: 50S ribosomal protein L1 [Elusimicrobia bacterium]|nr:50S ribosomal protein L1 [Elusimicrobiota bacterium]
MGKRIENIKKGIDLVKTYTVEEAVEIIKKSANAKFDETIELHVKLGIDPKQSDQQLRTTVALPHGTGKKKKIAVIAKGEKVKEAESAGAEVFGGPELIENISKGFMDFDVLVVTPDMMKDAAKLGKILGPKGLMPNPKSGTVTFDIDRTVKELKAGRIEFKNDAAGIIHTIIGKASFPAQNLAENIRAVMETVMRIKPSSAKGVYLQSAYVSSTMGPGVPLNPNQKF